MNVNDAAKKVLYLAMLGALIYYGSRLYTNMARKVPA